MQPSIAPEHMANCKHNTVGFHRVHHLDTLLHRRSHRLLQQNVILEVGESDGGAYARKNERREGGMVQRWGGRQ